MKRLLENRCFFKLVCGAGNESEEEVKRLVKLYSDAGCLVFDISARDEIVRAASAAKYKCISVGIKGDPHILKLKLNNERCTGCGNCISVCVNNALTLSGGKASVCEKRCLGCCRCMDVCPNNAFAAYSKDIDLQKVLPKIIKSGIDCIELHATAQDDKETDEKWRLINKYYNGLLSICIDRSNLGNKQVLSRVKRLIQNREPYTTIVQADGIPMSGSKDDYNTTLQTVAMAQIIQDANLPVYIVLSGGTNSKTLKLARQCGIGYHGVAVGSYARKIVNEYIIREDFWSNEKNYNNAVNIAKNFLEEIFS